MVASKRAIPFFSSNIKIKENFKEKALALYLNISIFEKGKKRVVYLKYQTINLLSLEYKYIKSSSLPYTRLREVTDLNS